MQTLILPTTKLTVKVTHEKGRRCLISHIFVQAGNVAVADATLGGKHTESSAREELRKAPHRFTLHQGYEAAKMLNLI